MSPQENRILQNFLHQLAQARGIAKDSEADALIAHAVSQQPDAAYLLVQRALLLEQALDTAKAQIAALQNQVQDMQSSRSGSFLNDAGAWGNSASSAQRRTMPSAAVAGAQQSAAATPAAAPGFLSGGAGGLMGNIAATAAGVAGGAFLFHGIGNLMGHHGGAAPAGQQQGIAALPSEPEKTAPDNHAADNTLSENSSLASDAGIDDVAGGDDGSSLL